MDQLKANIADALPEHSAELGGLAIHILHDLQPLQAQWHAFEARAVTTFYQTYAWCLAWLETMQSVLTIRPVIVVAVGLDREIAFILPLQLRESRGVRAIEFLTAPQADYGYGLFAPDFLAGDAGEWFTKHLNALLGLLPNHDLLFLRDMAAHFGGKPHPLSRHFNLQSANQAHLVHLQPDYQAMLVRKRSGESRRSMRKRDQKLAAMGNLSFGLPATGEDSHAIVAQMFDDQQARLGARGVRNVYTEAERRFIHRLLDARLKGEAFLRPYRLLLDGKVLCVALGGVYNRRFWSLVLSLADGPARKHSPGDFALRSLMEQLCHEGYQVLDLSEGDSDYKQHWTDETIPKWQVVRGRGIKGRIAALLVISKHWLKREIKSRKGLLQAAFALRQIMFGNRSN